MLPARLHGGPADGALHDDQAAADCGRCTGRRFRVRTGGRRPCARSEEDRGVDAGACNRGHAARQGAVRRHRIVRWQGCLGLGVRAGWARALEGC
ncbi:hypothetical protein G6F68_018207 [Rhizopus microsporus]|nr:hypothetical protein G6F68_018207 [Rhizopus microsporus]